VDPSEVTRTNADRARNDALQQARDLVVHLQGYDALSVLASAKLANLILNPNSYSEPEHEGRAAHVEYLALLLCREPLPEGRRVETRDDWEPVEAAVHDLFLYQMLIASLAAHADGHDADDLRNAVASHELIVRNPAYRVHHEVVLSGLFDPFETDFLRITGFSAQDASAVADAISNLEGKALNDAFQLSRDAAEELFLEPSLHYAKTGEWTGRIEPPIGYLDVLYDAPRREVLRAVRSLATVGAANYYADAQVFHIDQIAETSGVSVDRVRAFLDATSLVPGEISDDFLLPASVHPLTTRPYIRLSDDYIVVPTAGGVHSVLLRILEGILKPHQKVWNRYQAHRHDFTLNTGLRLLQQLMPAASVERELSYAFDDPEASGVVNGELDGLVQYDTSLFLVETKGHTLDDASRRGAPLRLRKRIGEILRGSHEQALRARRYLDGSSPATFTREDGTAVDIEGHDRRIYMVSLTLEPLGHVSGLFGAVEHESIFVSRDVPWAVCLYDLMVIADLLELPPAFPHYVERRLRAASQGLFSAGDELDFFGHYLANGLYYDNEDLVVEGESVDFIQLGSFTVEMDDYYLYEEGVRTRRAPKPKLTIDGKTRRLVERLDESGLPGRLDASLSVLDGAQRARKAVTDGLISGEKKAKRKGKPVGLVFDRSDQHGCELLILVVGVQSPREDIRERLDERLRKLIAERNATRGVIVAFAASPRRPLEVVSIR